jgi:hypothetical protein
VTGHVVINLNPGSAVKVSVMAVITALRATVTAVKLTLNAVTCLIKTVTLNLHSHSRVSTEYILAEVVAADPCYHIFNGSHFLHSSELSRLESCTINIYRFLSPDCRTESWCKDN